MTTNATHSTEITQQIEAQENELKELLCRVMKNPLQPLTDQAAQLEKRLQNVEDIAKATSEVNLPAMQRAIRDQGEEMQKNLKRLRIAITDELTDLLTTSLASMPQEITQLLQGQTSIKDLLNEVQQEQTVQGQRAGETFIQSEALLLKSFDQMNEINNSAKAAVQASDNAVARINESSEHIGQNLDSMQTKGRLEGQKIGDGITALAGSLNRTSAQVTDLAPTLSRQTDELSSRLESAFNNFRGQSEKDRTELSNSLQIMQKRFLWVSVLCGLSFAGSFGLVISRFVL